jgi:hypothetical protein
MITIQTLFGTYDEKQLKEIKGYIVEVNECLIKIADHQKQIKDIIEQASDATKIPKKILKKMAKTYHKQNFQIEVAETKEFEALFEGITEIK